jgi:small subunit ribosomal protein S7
MVSRFVNGMMYDGKKSLAYTIFYDAIDIVEKKVTEEPGIETFRKALNNVMPAVEVKARRVGGATFQIPMEVPQRRKIAVGMKWMIGYARKRNEKSMAEKLAGEILAASRNEGSAVKKKEDTHKMAEANKAFAHFRV